MEISAPIIRNIALYLVILIFIVTIIHILAWRLWARRLITPLVALRERVSAIFEGRETDDFSFPQNEFGEIAVSIGKLTKNALYQQMQKLKMANETIAEINNELTLKNDKLQDLAIHDHLTGLYNRVIIDETLRSELDRFERYGMPFSIAILDIDHFKKVNDAFGHATGDDVLAEISAILSSNVRKSDLVGRWGGEEFILLFVNTPFHAAYAASEKIRVLIGMHKFSIPENVTVSIGVGEIRKGEVILDIIRRVDSYLYEAKNNGRNRTCSE